jgi:F-box and leucine-rich repeat protein GRR1
VGVVRLRSYLNADSRPRHQSMFDQGTMFHDDGGEPEMMNVTAQANGMGIEDMDDDFGEGSEIMLQD